MSDEKKGLETYADWSISELLTSDNKRYLTIEVKIHNIPKELDILVNELKRIVKLIVKVGKGEIKIGDKKSLLYFDNNDNNQ